MTTLEQTVRRITADPNHYPQTSRAQAEQTADWILGYAAKMSTEWQNITAKMDGGDWFWIAETLTFWGLAEYDPRPAKQEYRRNSLTGERELQSFGVRCFFRLKPEALQFVEPESPPYQRRIVKARRVKDATGAYCLDCQRVIADDCQTCWHWRKSQRLHEQGTGHKTIMYKVV